MKTLVADLKTLYHLLLKPARGKDHAERMESFYAGQADAYDSFRRRLLPGRRELYNSISLPQGGVWVDLGGGTGENFEPLEQGLKELRTAYVVDLSPSLLAVAQERIRRHGWTNVHAVRADATQFRPLEGHADVVTFAYALTMIPDWFLAVENACAMLKPGGLVGVVDFFVLRKHPGQGAIRHSWLTRSFWPIGLPATTSFCRRIICLFCAGISTNCPAPKAVLGCLTCPWCMFPTTCLRVELAPRQNSAMQSSSRYYSDGAILRAGACLKATAKSPAWFTTAQAVWVAGSIP